MKARQALVPAGILLSIPLILYAPFLFGGKVLYWAVYLLQFYPWRQLAVEQIRAGSWPLWNSYLGAGTPLAANLQTGAFYPPNVIFLLMPVEHAFGWGLALHVAVAGLSAYYLGRTLGQTRFGALVTGLAYGGGGYLIAHWVFPSMVYAAAWLPLLLALAERLIQRCSPDAQASARHWLVEVALLALVVALQLLAGHAQTSFYSAVIVVFFALYRLAQRLVPGGGPRIRRPLLAAWGLLLAAAWGAALAAIQLLPTAELAAHSQRSGNLTDMTFAYELSFWPWRLITLLAPDFFGNPARGEYWAYGTYWEEAAFVGVLPLMLAVLALTAWWRKRKQNSGGPDTLVPFLVLLCLASVLLALGDRTPLYRLVFRYVPGFGLFQAPARLIIGYALGIALLAGIGADVLRITPRTRTALRVVLIAGIGVGFAALVTRMAVPAVRDSFANSLLRLGVSLAVASGVLLLRGRRLRGRQWEGLVIAVILVDLLLFGWGLAPGTDPAVYHAPVETAEFLETQPPGRVHIDTAYAQDVYDRYVSLGTFGSGDAAYLQGLRESLFPNLNSPHHLPGSGNYDPLTIGAYDDLYALLEGPDAPPDMEANPPLLNLFGARYLVSDRDLDLPMLYDRGPYIYANEDALPAAFVVHRARVVEDAQQRLEILQDESFDPRAEVILSHAPPSIPVQGAGEGKDATPSILREGQDRAIIDVAMTQPGYLVLTDTHYPGWQATVDGQPAEILEANHAFRAVQLDQGEHTVLFTYEPLSFRLGGWITLAALAVLATIPIISGRYRRMYKK